MTDCVRLAARLMGVGFFLAAILIAGRPHAAEYAALVMDAETGRILSQQSADQPRYPASLTKMMTLYLLFEALDGKALRLNTPMKVSAVAASRPPSRLGLKPGDTITVRQAILALITKSANDAATVVAERLGGNEGRFAEKMTTRARALGMKRTTFRNASGLPDLSQVTTARDMAILARALVRRFPHYYGYFAEDAFEFHGLRHVNHNRLLGAYDGVDGIKTGYIHASGFNLVASARRNGRRLIGVVFGADSPAERSHTMIGMLDEGFRALPSSSTLMVQQTPARPAPAAAGPAAALVAAEGAGAIAAETGSGTAVRGVMIASGDANAALKVAAERGWGIQVGAFSAAETAAKRAEQAAELAAQEVAGGSIDILSQESRSGATHYLARIHGLSRADAADACARLKVDKIGCFVVTLDDGSIEDSNTSTARSADIGDAVAGGDWGVQVGVYPRRASALATARSALGKAPALADGTIAVVPLKGRKGPLYRARIVGLEKRQAEAACRALKVGKGQCMVLRMSDVDREHQAASL
jgi:D-alanyl-D-alanine carboxypeptidase